MEVENENSQLQVLKNNDSCTSPTEKPLTQDVQHFENCYLRRNELNNQRAEKYNKQLGALVDIKRHHSKVLKQIEDKNNFPKNNCCTYNPLHETSSSKILDDERRLNRTLSSFSHFDDYEYRIHNFIKEKPWVEPEKRISTGGCGDPIIGKDGYKITRRTRAVRAIQGSTVEDSYVSVRASKEEETIEDDFDYPLLERDSWRRKSKASIESISSQMREEMEQLRKVAYEKEKKYFREDSLNEIRKQKLLKEEERKLERLPPGDMTTILAEGLVGKPERHPVTGIIIPHKKAFSDVTFPTLKHPNFNKSKNYIEELQAMAREKFSRMQENKLKLLEQDHQHVATFSSYFNKPGYGAPCDNGLVRRKFSECGIRASLGKMGTSIYRKFDSEDDVD